MSVCLFKVTICFRLSTSQRGCSTIRSAVMQWKTGDHPVVR